MNRNEDDKKLDWMYKGATSLVDREEYLLGRSVDKPLENLNQEERDRKLGILPPKNHVEHECIPPSIRDFNKIVQAEQVDLSAKLQEDPLMAIKKREEEARRQFLQNPIQLKKLQEALKSQDQKKKKKKRKKSDSDLDQKIAEKLKYLKHNPLTDQLVRKSKKQPKDNSLDIILMHKYNQLKDSLSQEDLDDILAGRISSSSDSENSEKSKRERRQSDTKKKFRTNEDIKDSNRQMASRRRKSVDEYDSENQEEKRYYKEENKRLRRDSDAKYSYSKSKYTDEGKKDYSSKKREKIDSDNSKRNNRKVSSEKDNSSEDESRKTKRKYSGTHQHDRKLKLTKSKKRQSDSSDSEDERKKKKSKYSSKYRKTEYVSESSDDDEKQKKRKLKKNKSNRHQKTKKNHSSSSSDSEDLTDKSQNIEKQHGNPQNISSDLDQMILKKLHMLRDNVLSNKTDKAPLYSHYDSDNDEPVYKVKHFGLIKSDGTKIPLKEKPLKLEEKPTKPKIPQKEFVQKRAKRLTSEEKEELRRQMMKDAEVREKERSNNLKKYREDNKKEEIERNTSEFDKNFVHKELLKSTKSATVESRIKSNLNNIQRSSRHMSTNFSKRT